MNDPRVWTVTVPGAPVGKSRARVVRGKNGKVHAYTPKKSANWEKSAAMEAKRVMANDEPTCLPVGLCLVAFMPIPKSWPAWKQGAAHDGLIKPTGKPDLDNMVKAAKDALNGIAWKDDSQVVSVTAMKTYGKKPQVVLKIIEVGKIPSSVSNRSELRELIA